MYPLVKGKNGVTYKSALRYNDYNIHKQAIVLKLITDLNQSTDSSVAGINGFIDNAATTIGKIIVDVQGVPEWKSSPVLRDKAVTFF